MSPSTRRTVGTGAIWLGVLAWAPFLYLVAQRQSVSIFPYLTMHLVGVLGGAWLRNSADRLEGQGQVQPTRGRRRLLLSKVMIYLGVLAWAPYFYFTRVLGQDLEMDPFLAAHLTGVLGGAAVRASVEVDRFLVRRKQP